MISLLCATFHQLNTHGRFRSDENIYLRNWEDFAPSHIPIISNEYYKFATLFVQLHQRNEFIVMSPFAIYTCFGRLFCFSLMFARLIKLGSWITRKRKRIQKYYIQYMHFRNVLACLAALSTVACSSEKHLF